MRAFAKINLGLEVDPRDADGFHPLRTIFAEISWADCLTVEPAQQWQLTVTGDAALGAEDLSHNLVWRAEQAIQSVAIALGHQKEAEWSLPLLLPSWHVTLNKVVPAGAGLGGGSADAAAWIRYRTAGWSESAVETIWQTASQLGKDLAFFRRGGIQRAEGYGDRLQPIPAAQFNPWVVVAYPGQSLSTARVYAAFDAIFPGATRKETGNHDALAAAEQSIRAGRIPNRLINQLEPAAHRVDPALKEFSEALRRWSQESGWCLTGSGSAYYILIADDDRAKWVYESIQLRVPRAWMGRIVAERPQ